MAEEEAAPPKEHKPGTSEGVGHILALLGAHKAVTIGIIAGIAVLYVIVTLKGKSATPSNPNTSTSASTCVDAQGNAVACSDSSSVGSLGASGYQDSGVAYALTQLGQQLNNLTAQATLGTPGPTGATGATGATGGTGTPGKGVNYPGILKAWPSNIKQVFGNVFTLGSTRYEIGPGSGGRVYGVPLAAGHKPLTLAQWNKVAIGSGSGQKVLLYGPATGGASTGGSPATPEKFPSPVGLPSAHTMANITQLSGIAPNRTESLYSRNRPTFVSALHPYQLSAMIPTGSIVGQMRASLRQQGMPTPLRLGE